MKIGTITYATTQGLGILVKSFYDNGVVTDVLVVEHSSRVTEHGWYPNAPATPIKPFDCHLARDFAASMDVMLFFETPFDWGLIPFCKDKSILTAVIPMYECMPRRLPACPDIFICPSLLDLEYYPDSTFIPVPVDVAWQQRNIAKVFIHNAGRLGLRGRNGTLELLQAMEYVDSPIELIIRGQDRGLNRAVNRVPRVREDSRITIEIGNLPHEELWKTGDVFVFPERFNGLSLPLQEAYASGMLVISTNRFPMNVWLPTEPLIPVTDYATRRISPAYLEFEEAQVNPQDIAATIDAWYNKDITHFSLSGLRWSRSMTWKLLKPRYLEALQL